MIKHESIIFHPQIKKAWEKRLVEFINNYEFFDKTEFIDTDLEVELIPKDNGELFIKAFLKGHDISCIVPKGFWQYIS